MTASEPAVPTSTATTRNSEPEIVAGISSAEGRPPTYNYVVRSGGSFETRVAMVGAAGVLGLVAGIGLLRCLR
ncbi:MAG TPA: hypothetical protein VFW46_02715 [Stellaceae bacterium]|nr:hypothetical protein [Stellaceae bacterium]